MTNLIDPPPEPSRPLPIGGVRCARCRTRLAEYFLPVYDVSDAVAAVTDAATEMTSQALLDVDPLKLGREAPLVGMLAALRMLPQVVGHLLHGERPAKPPESMRLRDLPSIPMCEGGWILLGERPGDEIAWPRRQLLAAGDRVRADRDRG